MDAHLSQELVDSLIADSSYARGLAEQLSLSLSDLAQRHDRLRRQHETLRAEVAALRMQLPGVEPAALAPERTPGGNRKGSRKKTPRPLV